MQHCKPINALIANGESLSQRMCPKTPQEEEYMRKTPYTSVVGSLIYVVMRTKPHICFAISMVSRYQLNLGPVHSKPIKWILMYLNKIANYSLCSKVDDLQLKGYTNADWEDA